MHGSIKNLIGKRYSRLLVIGISGRDKKRSVLWLCACDCGNTTVANGSVLKRRHKRSCGCLRDELSAIKAVARFTTHGMKYTITYKTWEGMIQRCGNTKNPKYPIYGGRGINVCARWERFENFYSDMGDRPSKKHSIERINNDDGYKPSNCKWAYPNEQNKNQRINARNKTGVRGVFWKRQAGKYQARISVDGRRIHLGYFSTIKAALVARTVAQKQYWGTSSVSPGRAFSQ